MKKILSAFVLIIFGHCAFPQSLNGPVRPASSQEKFISLSEEINATGNSARIVSDEINTKALKNFTATYKKTPDAKWFKLDNEFVAYFTSDGIKTRVFYDKKGNFEGLVRGYPEDKLPGEIRSLVKSTYYDFSIYHVNEVYANGITAYLVKISDNISWKTIKVIDYEMEEMEVMTDCSKN
jgi:hypothetical protein